MSCCIREWAQNSKLRRARKIKNKKEYSSPRRLRPPNVVELLGHLKSFNNMRPLNWARALRHPLRAPKLSRLTMITRSWSSNSHSPSSSSTSSHHACKSSCCQSQIVESETLKAENDMPEESPTRSTRSLLKRKQTKERIKSKLWIWLMISLAPRTGCNGTQPKPHEAVLSTSLSQWKTWSTSWRPKREVYTCKTDGLLRPASLTQASLRILRQTRSGSQQKRRKSEFIKLHF